MSDSIAHVAIIMDGNGRWAERQGLPRWKGHEAGSAAVKRVVEESVRQGIQILTLFAFSSENWKRPAQEVHILFSLFQRFLRVETASLLENGIRLSAIGRRDRMPKSAVHLLEETENATRGGERLHLRLALDYGSRHEIVEAVRRVARLAASGKVDPARIDEENFQGALYAEPVRDPDLIIRTAGERRLSNFLLWQAAYAEFYFCPKPWPEFDEADLCAALSDYRGRTRRFGALPAA